MDDATIASLIIGSAGLALAIITYYIEQSPKPQLKMVVQTCHLNSKEYRIIRCRVNNNGKKKLHLDRATLFVEKDSGIINGKPDFPPISISILNVLYHVLEKDISSDVFNKIPADPKLLTNLLKDISKHKILKCKKIFQTKIVPKFITEYTKELVEDKILPTNYLEDIKKGITKDLIFNITSDLLKQLNLVHFSKLDNLIGGVFINYDENLESPVIWPEIRSGIYRLTLLVSFKDWKGRIDFHRISYFSIDEKKDQ